MPQGKVMAEPLKGGRLDQLVKAKRRWNASVASLAVRMHAPGLLSPWQYRSIFVQRGRTNEPFLPEASVTLHH